MFSLLKERLHKIKGKTIPLITNIKCKIKIKFRKINKSQKKYQNSFPDETNTMGIVKIKGEYNIIPCQRKIIAKNILKNYIGAKKKINNRN